MVPLIPTELYEFCILLHVLSCRILDMPKSPTRALMSSARRMLLGLRSQWIINGWQWLWRYSIASTISTAISSLCARLSVLLLVSFWDFGWSQPSKLPLGMNSKTNALNSWLWWLMLEQQVMIFMRHWCGILLMASHSTSKLLEDLDWPRLNTLTAKVLSSVSKHTYKQHHNFLSQSS